MDLLKKTYSLHFLYIFSIVIFTSRATQKDFGIGRRGSVAAQRCQAYTAQICGKSHRRGLHRGGHHVVKIVGGRVAQPKEFPHMAAMGSQYADPYWFCGASLISDSFVVTAAHCISYAIPEYLRFGDLDLASKSDNPSVITRRVTKYIVHPSYNLKTQYNDIALLRFERLAAFTDHIRPICLHVSEQIPNRKLGIVGWGKRSEKDESFSSQLRYTELDNRNHAECYKQFENYNDKLMICAGYAPGGKDACKRDSGGPLQILNTPKGCSKPIYSIVGIISKGFGCGRQNVPGVYTKISHFVPWIESIVWNK